MSKYSDEEAVEAAVLAAEADYEEALADYRGNPDDEELVARYKEARDAYFNARQASRAGRGMAITTE